jgi:predicted amino acid dehydrogenase
LLSCLDTTTNWTGCAPVAEWLDSGRAILDSVLLTHPRDEGDFPTLFRWGCHLSPEERRQLTRWMRPVLAEVVTAPGLASGLLVLPFYADDIMGASPARCLRIVLDEALPFVSSVGARVVSLGGLVGALTDYGKGIEARAAGLGIRVTTGHCLTAISIERVLVRAVDELGIDLARSRVAVLGAGSVGAACARLIARGDHPPRELVLIDRPNRNRRLAALAQELGETSPVYARVEFTEKDGRLAPDSLCHESSVIVSATSSPDVLDVDRISPGTLLIDDSQPNCWSREKAWARYRREHDIAPCETGLVDCRNLGYRSRFPFYTLESPDDGSSVAWSCLAEGLLLAREPDLPPTIGEPTAEMLSHYQAAFGRWGLSVPPLQCGNNRLDVDLVRESFTRPSRPGRASHGANGDTSN